MDPTTPASAPTTPTRAEIGLPDDAFVFCSFNAAHKITRYSFDRWLEILQAEGFVRRYATSADAEIAIFELSPRGCVKVEQCLLGNGDFRC